MYVFQNHVKVVVVVRYCQNDLKAELRVRGQCIFVYSNGT